MPPSNSSRNKALALGELVRALGREVQLLDRSLCGRSGLSPAQWYALNAVAQCNLLGMNELAEQLRVSRSTLTRLVDQLERKELVRRRPDSRDRRHTRLESTPAGQRLHAELLQEAVYAQQAILRTLPRADWSMLLGSAAQLHQAMSTWTRRHLEPGSPHVDDG